MKETNYFCDICKSKVHHIEMENSRLRRQVIFETETTEGRACKPYITSEDLDLCEECIETVLTGEAIFASGAMGYNKYYFKSK